MNDIILGDSTTILRGLQAESVDLIATDPPYGYSFMGKDWDKAVPSVEVWKECLRALKPGAFMFVMSSPRQDVLSQMIVRLGQAGFDTGFTSVYWAYASGFPKSENVSLQIDKRACHNELTEKLGRKPIKFCKQYGKEVSLAKSESLCFQKNCVKDGKPCVFLNDEFREAWKTFRKLVTTINHSADKYFKSDYKLNDGRNPEVLKQYAKDKLDITVPTSNKAKVLDGSYGGFQPKPAVEVIIVCMKPLSEKTYVDQALKNGKGVTWLDNARIPFQNKQDFETVVDNYKGGLERSTEETKENWQLHGGGWKLGQGIELPDSQKGRFPANLLVSDDILNDGKNHVSGHMESMAKHTADTQHCYGDMKPHFCVNQGDEGSFSRFFDLDKWFSEQLKKLPKEVRETFPFLITPKASKEERNKGCEKIMPKAKCKIDKMGGSKCTMKTGSGNERNVSYKNFHPTVKPLALMSYLITLGSRPKDIILDPFVGSGTTCLAAKMLGRRYIGIDNNPEYIQIANARLNSFQTLDSFQFTTNETEKKP